MKTYLVAGRLDGQFDALEHLQSLADEHQPEGLLYAGNILGEAPGSHAERRRSWEAFFDALAKLGGFSAVIPGPADAPLRDFLQVAKNAEVAHANVAVVHAAIFEKRGIAICGLGGELTDAVDETKDRVAYARATAEYYLRGLWRSKQSRKVLLLSVPPNGRLGGERGNPICGEIIDSYHPQLCVVAGATDCRGVEQIANTTVINPGRLADRSVAFYNAGRSKNRQVEFLEASPVFAGRSLSALPFLRS